jgi:2-keto-4-pentenoate hydratase/2-oxohepta-3-ene-1,7-dioic acid hydratase in catechol pathway
MKLVTFKHAEKVSYGVLRDENIHDLGAQFSPLYPTLRSAIENMAFNDLDLNGDFKIPLSAVTLLPPIPDPEKIICIGLNYRAHAAEGGFSVPENPSLFARLTNSLVGTEAPMILPVISSQFDYEGELALIIGKSGRHIDSSRALEYIFGYSCFNDASLRDIQFNHSLTAGKNFPSTGGFGPWIVTSDEIPDPKKLILTTRLNGKQVQKKGIDDMIFDVASIVAYVSSWTDLRAGDVIATGTPEGVGFARKPQLWMRSGDIVEVEISDIGILRNTISSEIFSKN